MEGQVDWAKANTADTADDGEWQSTAATVEWAWLEHVWLNTAITG